MKEDEDACLCRCEAVAGSSLADGGRRLVLGRRDDAGGLEADEGLDLGGCM